MSDIAIAFILGVGIAILVVLSGVFIFGDWY